MQFDVLDLVGRHAGGAAGGADHGLLGLAAGGGQAGAAAVVVDGAAADDGVDPVPVVECGPERFEDDQARAFGTDVAVGAGIERVAVSVGGEPGELARGDVALARQGQVDAAGEGEHALAAPQALAGEVDRHQGGRLSGVDDQARPPQAVEERDAVGDDAAVGAGERVPADPVDAAAVEKGREVAPDGPHEHPDGCRVAGVGRPETGERVDPRVLEGLPAQLQHDALLGIHLTRLARTDPEECGVETEDGVAVEVAAVARVDLARRRHVGVVELFHRPAVIRGLTDGVDAVAQQLPEPRGILSPGQPAGHSDDGDGVGCVGAVRTVRRVARHRGDPSLRPALLECVHARQDG
nr:hypothetical protein [Catenulispora rubra]